MKIIKKFLVKKTLSELIMDLLMDLHLSKQGYFRAVFMNPDMEFQYMAVVKESEIDDNSEFKVKKAKYHRNKECDWKIVPRMGRWAYYVEGITDPITKPIFDVQIKAITKTAATEDGGQYQMLEEEKLRTLPIIHVPYMDARKYSERQNSTYIQELKTSPKSKMEEYGWILWAILVISALVAASQFGII